MIVKRITTRRPQIGDTKTFADFASFLNNNPENLGVMSSFYPEFTTSFITEAIFNVHTGDASKEDSYTEINSMAFKWDIKVPSIKTVEFAAVPVGTGRNKTEITMAFKEKYYEKNDTFKVTESRQIFVVMARPVRLSDDYWQYTVKLMDNSLDSEVDTSACQVGKLTTWVGTVHPELSEEGYTKSSSNVESRRNYISLHRNDVTFSSAFAAMEDVFIETVNGKKGKIQEEVYTMKTKESELMKTFLEGRNNTHLSGKSNYDANGRCLIQDAQGRDLPSGDGLIAQIEQGANKQGFNKLSPAIFREVMEALRAKADSDTGNSFVFLCNTRFYDMLQQAMDTWLKDYKTDGTWLWSKDKGGKINIGATFDSYIYGGNQISFKVDRALNYEYGDQPFAIAIDLTADAQSGKPAMMLFTLRGQQFIRATVEGVGGLTGTKSGSSATKVAGSSIVHMGYSGLGLFNPYRSFMLRGSKF